MKQCLLPEISKNSEYKVTVVFKFYQVWHKILQGWGTDSKKYNLWRNQVAFISTAGIDSYRNYFSVLSCTCILLHDYLWSRRNQYRTAQHMSFISIFGKWNVDFFLEFLLWYPKIGSKCWLTWFHICP